MSLVVSHQDHQLLMRNSPRHHVSDVRHGLLGYMDRNETKDIRWAFDYWHCSER